MEIQFVSGLSTRSPLLSPHAPGWRSNRLCVIKWWWWLYLTFIKGGAPDFCRSVLSASIQWINPHTARDRVKMFFLGVNTGVILRWMVGMCLPSVVCLLSVSFSLYVYVCACDYMLSPCFQGSLALPSSPAKWRRMITYQEVNFISMEIPEGTWIQEIFSEYLSVTCSCLRDSRDDTDSRNIDNEM